MAGQGSAPRRPPAPGEGDAHRERLPVHSAQQHRPFLGVARTALATEVSDDTLAQTLHSTSRRWLARRPDLHWAERDGGVWQIKVSDMLSKADYGQLVARHKQLEAQEAQLVDNLSILAELEADGETDLHAEGEQLGMALVQTQLERSALAGRLRRILSAPVDGEDSTEGAGRAMAWLDAVRRAKHERSEHGAATPEADA